MCGLQNVPPARQDIEHSTIRQTMNRRTVQLLDVMLQMLATLWLAQQLVCAYNHPSACIRMLHQVLMQDASTDVPTSFLYGRRQSRYGWRSSW